MSYKENLYKYWQIHNYTVAFDYPQRSAAIQQPTERELIAKIDWWTDDDLYGIVAIVKFSNALLTAGMRQ